MINGYLYCFSNDSMPNILNVGMTERTPDLRLIEANSSDTWRPPMPYKIEVAKKVLNPKQKEITLHRLLTKYTERINHKREFFRISVEDVKKFFDLIDGDYWIENEEENENEEEINLIKGCRDMTKCFVNGQQIRHTIDITPLEI